MRKNLLGNFSSFDLMAIALLAAVGVAVSGVVGWFVRLFTSALFIPGGAVAGGIYMMFLVLAVAVTNKKTAALLVGLVQAIMVMVTGLGSHGFMTIVTYSMPGVAVLALLLIMRKHMGCCKMCCFFACMVANMTGTYLVSVYVMTLPLVPTLLSIALAAISGGLGGLLTHSLGKQIKKLGVI
ncbi:MAG: ECF transporter S component [Defluviitaleaceae bacterium]|nr:ECF transporter S component [Defluviitaleaceae bacterium]